MPFFKDVCQQERGKSLSPAPPPLCFVSLVLSMGTFKFLGVPLSRSPGPAGAYGGEEPCHCANTLCHYLCDLIVVALGDWILICFAGRGLLAPDALGN